MHVFLSDLHLTDWEFGSSVSDAELVEFCNGQLSEFCKDRQVTLVLLGDVVDLLRSPRWADLWTSCKGAPWKGLGKNFKGFDKSHGEDVAVQVADGIQKRYSGFSQALETLVESTSLSIVYIFGNHDYMVQLSPKIRQVLCDFLHLAHNPEKPFRSFYADESASVFAIHGHTYDPLNWHRAAEGYWAFGDAVVLRIVNRFAAEACKELGVKESSDLGRQLHEIDNIEPNIDVPVYVRWLTDEALTIEAERKTVRAVWNTVVDDFLSDMHYQDSKGYSDSPFQTIRYALKISRSETLTNLLQYVSSVLPQGTNYHQQAELLARDEDKYRFIVFGHTHRPGVAPISHSVNEQPAYYVNTGCWRRVVTRPSSAASGPFVGTRVSSVFWIGDSDSSG